MTKIRLIILRWIFRFLVIAFGGFLFWSGSFFTLFFAFIIKIIAVILVVLVEAISDLLVSFCEPVNYYDPKYKHPNFSHKEEDIRKIRISYYSTIFKVAGYLISNDNNFDDSEKKYLANLIDRLGLDFEERKLASDCVRSGVDKSFNIKQTLNEFQQNCLNQEEMMISFIEIQFEIVWSDQKVSFFQINTLDLICQTLGYKNAFDSLLAEYRLKAQMHESQKAEQEKSYGSNNTNKKSSKTSKKQKDRLMLSFHVLGLTSGATMNEIKVAYRHLIKAHHPDTLIAQGYPIEMLQQATERSAEINKAYNFLKANHKLLAKN